MYFRKAEEAFRERLKERKKEMKKRGTPHRDVYLQRSGPHVRSHSLIALTLCLVLGTSLMTGCALGAAVGALSAVTTAGVLVSAVEDAVRFAHERVSLVVRNGTEIYTGPGEEYSRIGRLNRGLEVQVVASRGDWLKCSSCLLEKGWIHRSRVEEM
jgi:hypothetical protein